ncbi:MAG: molybdopterin-guanine dinucleotide biosynthesis protein B [Deferrisomatales bacterium]
MIPICLVSGPSGSGKTTLVERLVPALAQRGVTVATVKHHRGRVDLDRPGKDTWRHRRAGARATFFVTEGEVAAFFDRPADLTPADLARLCPPGVRLVLVEGFKGLTGYPRVEVVRRGVDREVRWDDQVLCVATDRQDLEAPCPVFALDDVGGIAELLVRRLL